MSWMKSRKRRWITIGLLAKADTLQTDIGRLSEDNLHLTPENSHHNRRYCEGYDNGGNYSTRLKVDSITFFHAALVFAP